MPKINGVAILISDDVDFKQKLVQRDKESSYTLTKRTQTICCCENQRDSDRKKNGGGANGGSGRGWREEWEWIKYIIFKARYNNYNICTKIWVSKLYKIH